MRFTSVLAVSASLLAVGYAADPLAFNSWPKDIQAGKPVTLTWSGADPHEPVTLTLKKGAAGNLDDVEIITDEAKDGTFTWTPGDNVKDGNYAFQVSQKGQKNYSGLLKAAPAPDNSQSASDASASTTGTTASATQATDMTQTTDARTSSKPLISSSSAATPSSSPASTTVVSSTVSAAGPFMTNTGILNGKEASTTGGMQNGAALAKYSTELALGAVAAFIYLGY
ncbi:hypothetical protein N7492_001371 [Penicillium capsulatum]|uniref:Yeast cell wall synthesis Kre9/Knh1-like N-terminal domain-containing protein n=1 Tax=Penicillium capsulatum TaxID=69766 RepID=A0A9W9IS97_9EURO|nr:hypothetical protein N7492_001371 [Penicillium capsulatum]KAJ6129576.1 hypothetical protein N7512_002356 [Penicillium capsulatum]